MTVEAFTAVYPDASIVAAAWIMSIPGIQIDAADVQFPWDLSTPVQYGYAQLTVVGGAPLQDAPYFQSVLQCDCWVEAPSEDRVFQMQANALAKQIQYAAYDRKNAKRGVTPSPFLFNGQTVTYRNAHVETVYTMQEPHKIVSTDNPMYEGVSFDLTMTWTTGITVN